MADQTLDYPRSTLTGIAGFYFTGEDWLRITASSITNTLPLTVSGRFLPFDRARPEPLQHRTGAIGLTPAAVGEFPLGEGWLQNVVVALDPAALTGDSVVVRLEVVRGRGAAAVVVAILNQGSINTTYPLIWGPAVPAGTGATARLSARVNTAAPAAGTQASMPITTGRRWIVQSLTCSLTTSAAVATREVVLTLTTSGVLMGQFPAAGTQAASLTRNYTGAAIGAALASATSLETTIAIPPLELTSGMELNFNAFNLQAADQFTGISACVLQLNVIP